MTTSLFDDIIFGPVQSRRLGKSLGVNVLSPEAKICNFDCIYCECGWTNLARTTHKFADPKEVEKELELKLSILASVDCKLDYITFAGNGEPTLHPHFEKIVGNTIELKDRYMPQTKVALLSNATTLRKRSIQKSLEMLDKCILKLDAGTEEVFELINSPLSRNNFNSICNDFKRLKSDFSIQSMFLKGEVNGKRVDNTQEDVVNAWIQKLLEIKPKDVMLYSIARATPLNSIQKVSKKELKVISKKLKASGLTSFVSA